MSAGVESGLRTARRGPVLELTIDRPHRMNALDAATVEELVAAIEGADAEVRVIVVAGAGGAFSAGADLAAMTAQAPVDQDQAEADAAQTMARAESLVRAVLRAPVPVIAAVDGPAVGVAASLALACDLIYATAQASFLLPFVRVGLMPDGGSSLLVAAAGGRVRAGAMMLLAQPMSGDEALAAGMVTALAAPEELTEMVAAVADRLAAGSRRALELTKQALTAATLAGIDEALARENTGQRELLVGPDFAEGARAMLEKRRPRFA